MASSPLVAGRRALILDDDPMVGVLLEELVVGFGFVTRRAKTVAEARKTLEKFDPDVALVDIDLGSGPTGLDFARILGKSYPHIGVLFLSRFSEDESGVNTLSGMPPNVAYLSKLDLYQTGVVKRALEGCLRPSQSAPGVTKERLISSQLTKVQYDLVVRIAAGQKPAQIARDQNKTLRTVEMMMNRIQDAHPGIILDSKRARVESASAFLERLPS